MDSSLKPTIPQTVAAIFRGKRRFIGLAILMAVVAVFYYAVMESRQITGQAFVNAPVVTLRSPIPGRTNLSNGIQIGQHVTAGTELANIRADVENQRVSELRTQIATMQTRRDSLLAEAKSVNLQILHRHKEQDKLAWQSGRQNLADISGAQADVSFANAERERIHSSLKQAQADMARADSLLAAGFISSTAYDKSKGEVERAKAAFHSEEARAHRAEVILAAARDGLQIEGARGLPYVQTRASELSESGNDLRARHQFLLDQLNQINKEIETLNNELALQSSTRLIAPVTGKVWNIDSNSGDAVTRQGPVLQLVDCSQPWVEAFLDEKQATSFHQGDMVRVLPYYGQGEWRGEVISVRFGTGRVTVGQYVVDPPPEVMRRQLPVRVSTIKIRVHWDKQAHIVATCDVGRSVEIRRL